MKSDWTEEHPGRLWIRSDGRRVEAITDDEWRIVPESGKVSPIEGTYGTPHAAMQALDAVDPVVEDTDSGTSETITLRPGDFVDLTDADTVTYHRCARAFLLAGAEEGEYPHYRWVKKGLYPFLHWRKNNNELWHHSQPRWPNRRELTVEQVLAAEKENSDGDETAAAPTRASVLDTAKDYVTNDRQSSYGDCEDNFQAIATLWGTYLRTEVAPADVAAMMILLKTARLMTSPGHTDNWIDVAGYAACGGEITGRTGSNDEH